MNLPVRYRFFISLFLKSSDTAAAAAFVFAKITIPEQGRSILRMFAIFNIDDENKTMSKLTYVLQPDRCNCSTSISLSVSCIYLHFYPLLH